MLYKSATPRATKSQAGRSITTRGQETLQLKYLFLWSFQLANKSSGEKEIWFKNPSRSESQQIFPLIQQLSVSGWKAGLAHVPHLYRFHMESGQKLTKHHHLLHHSWANVMTRSVIRVISSFPCKHPCLWLRLKCLVSFRTQQPIQLCGKGHSAISAEILQQQIFFSLEPSQWTKSLGLKGSKVFEKCSYFCVLSLLLYPGA